MYLVLALTAAASWGASDFVGGMVGRRVPGASVAFASQAVGLAALVVVAPLAGGSAGAADVAWGACAGLGGAAGVLLLYQGLAAGKMSVVAPLTAVGSASIPVVYGLLTGERPSAASLVGVVLALAAVAVLCAFGEDDAGAPGEETAGTRVDAGRAGLVAGAGAGVGFAVFFICLGRTGDDAGLWPLLGARGVSTTALAVLVLATSRALVPGRGTGPAILLTGALDVVANGAYLLATREGLLSIVALLASLYPAGTVLLARIVLHERLTATQALGLAGAAVAVVVIAVG